MHPRTIKAKKRAILRQRILLAVGLVTAAAAGALGHQLYYSHGLTAALATTVGILTTILIITIDDSEL